MTNRTNQGSDQGQQASHGGLGMMVLMMACCMSIVLLFLLIPIVGWTIGITIGAAGIVAMLFAHQRWMGHGGHH